MYVCILYIFATKKLADTVKIIPRTSSNWIYFLNSPFLLKKNWLFKLEREFFPDIYKLFVLKLPLAIKRHLQRMTLP